VGVTFLELGRWTVVVGLAIAGIKATLVVLFFMHVRESSTLTKFMCAAGLVWLIILMTLTFSDYISRTWLPTPGGW
jgi:cytochrome c oxidase subunit 4